ncbi:Neuraminyllactose-binding hemagglutinin [Helicobacter sp. NHP19-012]|uniref:Neuraminyllactose-binding hemagglutinin n=1 Tax=Helicobacter gastrofelis TaxID=2849642 RepID=A0ABM7SLS3_9HELI|nr:MULTISPECIES: HpaA family protein [unclassified Helicobacter]BCZ18574.1 Neuraminyllactose-binding hemagglutinin [Helicobacter sp. NHP19-012]GMB95846.1 Neuraminyllactose-binding hemagglutinin [Helicobacter sp. NHP22-001]
MQKHIKGILSTLMGISLALSGCATDTGTQAASNQPHAKSATPINFNYPIHIGQEPPNDHITAILTPHIQADENVQPYIAKFQNALATQVQEILQRKGYTVIRIASAKDFTPTQKNVIYSLLKIKGWIGILEETNIDTKNPQDPNTQTQAAQSAGAVILQFIEPKTGRTTHNIAINIGAEHAITYSNFQESVILSGFAGAGSVSLGDTANNANDADLGGPMDKNHDDAVHRILNKVYKVVLERVISWAQHSNLKQYRQVIDQIRK